jgi:hypothetical protein
MTQQVLSPGDVLGFPIERIGRFGVCQVVAKNAANDQVTVTLLDWVGEAMPTLNDVADVPRLVKSFMFWQPREIVDNVPLPAPSRYRAIGTLPVRGSTESNSHGGWNFDDIVARQHRWNTLPAELTAAFKASLDTAQTAVIPGLECTRSGEPMQTRLAAPRSFRDDGGYRIADEFRMASLCAWPALYQVFLQRWRDDLVPFLESASLVSELSLVGHGQREIDLSRTHIDRLVIDIDGLERLVLPQSLSMLIVHGKSGTNSCASVDELVDVPSAETPDAIALTHVVAEQNGRWISVQAHGAVPPLHGLDQARGLRLDAVSKLDLCDVADSFPDIGYLHLFGAPGELTELAALAELPKLEALWLCDLFGYGPEDFPAPDALPVLTSLSLDSVPAEVAAGVRKAFKKTPRVALSVRKPRSPEWLSENLENPLRHWDGREGIPAAAVKKTRAAFVSALRQVREADATRTDDAAYTARVTQAAADFLAVVGGLNRKYGFLYTLERDEVVDAVNMLTVRLSHEARVALDLEEALDD